MERKWWTLVAVCMAIFMLLLDITIVNVALPAIQRALDASFSDLQWVVDAYALALATCVLTAGSLADLFGRKRVFMLGIVLFTAASLACGARQRPALPDHRPRRAGNRRRDDVRDRARADLAGVPRQGARHGLRDLGRDDRRRGRDRPARRRDAHLVALVALDLPRQHPDRRRRGRARAARSSTSRATPSTAGSTRSAS